MKKLYNANGNIKLDLIGDALQNAKKEGNLPNVPFSDIKYFIESLEQEIEKFPKVGEKINKHEMEFLLKQMIRNKHDKITDKELQVIGKILLDTDFDIE
ncbi:MAG: hypothetical protein P1P85_02235 [Patescibacteria group bacterium]|nr:hypothetical protein [Patescibacteria group bacterium]